MEPKGRMNNEEANCLVILAGGRSRRMGRDKANVEFQGQRLIDRIMERYRSTTDTIHISGSENYDTGISYIPDNPVGPPGPVGAIFSICAHLSKHQPHVSGFCTVPVDAPFAPLDLVPQLNAQSRCAVASTNGQLHPTFAYWRCDIVEALGHVHDPGAKSPSLHWLARQCDADVIEWRDAELFANINTPEELAMFSKKEEPIQ